ncbi:MAG: DUF2520 domain-containing protein [Flavobacteriaceae bacterium]
MISIAIVGSGRVAKQLFDVFNKSSLSDVSLILGRSEEALSGFKNVKTSINWNVPIAADLVLIAVSDKAIAEVSSKLICPNTVVCHVSGAVPLTAIEGHPNKGVFYPLQTFGSDSPLDFKIIPILIEASDKKTELFLQNIARDISERVQILNSEKRKNLHLSAVWVNNFSTFLFGEAQEFCKNKSIDFTLLEPLIRQTIENTIKYGAQKVQTGPARRRDNTTVAAHLKMLESDLHKNIYRTLSNAIGEKYAHEL